MTRRILASMLFLALLFAQGAAALCGVRCLSPAGAKPMNSASCHGMVMADSGTQTHVAAPCKRHICPVDTLDALVEDHHGLAHVRFDNISLPVVVLPDEVRVAEPSNGPPAVWASGSPPVRAGHPPLTDSLRV
ncbi:hypothetical protein [Granulicella sibirica]|nr:hypothetical protein [Granulicella sibirica]